MEHHALEMLKIHDSNKYKNAVISDKPDIQSKTNNIGVEVVTADFTENAIMDNLRGKTFLQFLKMTNCHSMKAEKVKNLIHQNSYNFKLFLEEKPYIEKNKQAVSLEDLNTLFEIKDNSRIYLTKYKKFNYIKHKNGDIKYAMPPAQWVGNLPHIMLDRYKEKNDKLKTYTQFEEMNLYIHTLMADIEEIEDFKKLLAEDILKSKAKYNVVYVLNNWGEKK